MAFIDLTHTFTAAMPVYPGESPPEWTRMADPGGDGSRDPIVHYQLKSGMHVGTHLDAPLHMLADGKFLSQIPPEKFIGRGVLMDARGKPVIDDSLLKETKILEGDIVLVMTGCSKKFGAPAYYQNYPELTESFARQLVKKKIKMVGLDSPSPDREPYTIHKILLKEEILIIENLTNLERLIDLPHFEVIAFPPKFQAEAAPVRVVARTIEKVA